MPQRVEGDPLDASSPRHDSKQPLSLDRPKLNDIQFFDMMGQVIRVKYRIDPTSLSCILEVFFGKIFSR